MHYDKIERAAPCRGKVRGGNYQVAIAAGRDAANRNMVKEGRTFWNEDDWNIMADTVEKVMMAA